MEISSYHNTRLNGIEALLGYHTEETHGPFPVATNLMGGRLPSTPPSGMESSVTYGRSWKEAVEAVTQRYSHRFVPGPVDPGTKRMDIRQGGASDLSRTGGLALVRKAFGRDVSIGPAHSIESAPAGYAFQQMSGFLVEQPSIPTVGLAGAAMRGTPPELIEQGLSIVMARAYQALASGSTPTAVEVGPSSAIPPYADVLERIFWAADHHPPFYSKLRLWTVKRAILKIEETK